RGFPLADSGEVVPDLPNVSQRFADQLAAEDEAVLRKDVLALSRQAELLEVAALGLARDVLGAPAIDLAPRPVPHAAPSRPNLADRIPRVLLPADRGVEVHVQVVLQGRVIGLAPDQV